jgi:site-specific recombinase XerD
MFKKHIRTHSFRATLITELLAQGVPIQNVKDILGDARIESTLKYDRNKLRGKKIDKLIAERYKDNVEQEVEQKKTGK